MERAVNRLLWAMAEQVAASEPPALAPRAAAALAELTRAEAGAIFGCAGHLVHYDADTPALETLVRLISDIQRGEAGADDAIVPGDGVRLVGELPAPLAQYDQNLLREMVFIVRYVGDDDTIDVQPTFDDDYVIETVPAGNVELIRPLLPPLPR